VTTFLFRVGTVQPLDTTIEILPSLDVACSAVAWGQGGQCSNVPLPCNPLVPTFCPGGGTCIPLDHQPGCDILAELTGARVLGPCSVPCGDANGDGVSDDACIWWECETTNCMTIPRGYADLGGVEGICGPDGVCDGNDRYHALNCFSDLDTGGPGTHYPCEESPPSALNVDAASMRQPCVADGVCDGNDAFAALNCFSNMTTCSCNGPAPAHAAPPTPLGRTTLAARAAAPRVRPGETVSVDVYLEDGLDDLRGYQLHVHPAGGESGRLELVDIAVRPEMAPPFAGLGAWEAFNVNVGQMVAGLDAAGVPAAAGSYLATFTFRASKDAAGAFSIEILADAKDHSQRTVLFPTPADGWITVDSTTPAVVEVLPARSARLKARRGD
jgi:hypothetical protein